MGDRIQLIPAHPSASGMRHLHCIPRPIGAGCGCSGCTGCTDRDALKRDELNPSDLVIGQEIREIVLTAHAVPLVDLVPKLQGPTTRSETSCAALSRLARGRTAAERSAHAHDVLRVPPFRHVERPSGHSSASPWSGLRQLVFGRAFAWHLFAAALRCRPERSPEREFPRCVGEGRRHFFSDLRITRGRSTAALAARKEQVNDRD